jgi:quinol monooxygenase YgiN
MIHVVVMVRVKDGRAQEYIDLFKSITPTVRKEKGCIEYKLTIDAPGAPADAKDSNAAVILERWESMEDLQAHLGTAHMAEYFVKQKDLVEDSKIKILVEA